MPTFFVILMNFPRFLGKNSIFSGEGIDINLRLNVKIGLMKASLEVKMKIKEVIAATGLTDRAIRLYIEHGLLFPDTKESYSGRRNIEFSDEDVKKLCNISTLRTAGFSIAQIKTIDEGGTEAEMTLHEFMEEKRSQQELNGRVISAIERFIACGNETNLAGVAAGLADEASGDVPMEDLKESRGERGKKVLSLILGFTVICVSFLELIYTVYYYMSEFSHPTYSGEGLTLICAFIPPVTLLMTVWFLSLRCGRLRIKTKKSFRTVMSIVLSVVLILSVVSLPVRIILAWCFPCVSSRTEDYSDYLEFDTWIITETKGEILKLFPDEIPETVVLEDGDSVRYYYNFEGGLGAAADIYAGWTIKKRSEFNKEMKRIDKLAEVYGAETSDSEAVRFYSFESADGAEGLFMAAYDSKTGEVGYGYYYDTSDGVFLNGSYSIDPRESHMGKLYFGD